MLDRWVNWKYVGVGAVLLATFAAGSAAQGQQPDPVVQYKYLSIPTVKYQDRPQPVKTITVYAGLPDSCIEAKKVLTEMHAQDKNISDQAGMLVEKLNEGGGMIFAKDQPALNGLIGYARLTSQAINTAHLANEQQVPYLNTVMAKCAATPAH